jgi:hypothetical protein
MWMNIASVDEGMTEKMSSRQDGVPVTPLRSPYWEVKWLAGGIYLVHENLNLLSGFCGAARKKANAGEAPVRARITTRSMERIYPPAFMRKGFA